MRKIIALLFALGLPATSFATCSSRIVESTPTTQFILNDDGTATDTKTGLMWMRCSLGQTWSNGVCTGTPLMLNWKQAIELAEKTNFAQATDWRLPNISELVSIVEHSCAYPAVNTTVFPNTPGANYWTSSAAKCVGFAKGLDNSCGKDGKLRIRLVKVSP